MADVSAVGRFLLASSLAVAAIGAVLVLSPRIPGLDRLGHLPGDIVVERGSITMVAPVVSSIVVSVVLTIVLNLVFQR